MNSPTPTSPDTALVPRSPRVLEGAVELSAERTADPGAALVWIPGEGRAIQMRRDELPADYFNPRLQPDYQPRDLTPQPVVDPIAQRIAAGGIGLGAAGAGVGWGLGQAMAGIAAFSGSGTVLGMVLGLLLARACGPSTTVHHHETHVTHRSLLARSTVTTTGGAR